MPDVDKNPNDVEIFIFARPYYFQIADLNDEIDYQGISHWTNCKSRGIGVKWLEQIRESNKIIQKRMFERTGLMRALGNGGGRICGVHINAKVLIQRLRRDVLFDGTTSVTLLSPIVPQVQTRGHF